MKSPVVWLVASLFCFACAFSPPLLPPGFRARLLVNPHLPARMLPAGLVVLIKSNGRILQNTRPGPGGEFSLRPASPADSVLDIFCVAPGLDTLFLQSVSGIAADAGLHQLLFPCEPDTTASGDIICPKCHKDDQVYPMVYGDPIVITRHFDTTGKVSYEQRPNKTEPADTVVHAARFYCRREKITF